MKITVTMKDPDVLQDAIEDALKKLSVEGLSEEEMELVREKRQQEIYEMAADKWFEYGEYLRVEIDTDAETCTVLRS